MTKQEKTIIENLLRNIEDILNREDARKGIQLEGAINSYQKFLEASKSRQTIN